MKKHTAAVKVQFLSLESCPYHIAINKAITSIIIMLESQCFRESNVNGAFKGGSSSATLSPCSAFFVIASYDVRPYSALV